MTVTPRHLALVFGIALAAGVFDLVRRRRLREANALPWLLLGMGAILLGLWPALWRALATRLGGGIAPLLALLCLFFLLVGLQLSADITVLRRQVKILARKVAFLEDGTEEDRNPSEKGRGGR